MKSLKRGAFLLATLLLCDSEVMAWATSDYIRGDPGNTLTCCSRIRATGQNPHNTASGVTIARHPKHGALSVALETGGTSWTVPPIQTKIQVFAPGFRSAAHDLAHNDTPVAHALARPGFYLTVLNAPGIADALMVIFPQGSDTFTGRTARSLDNFILLKENETATVLFTTTSGGLVLNLQGAAIGSEYDMEAYRERGWLSFGGENFKGVLFGIDTINGPGDRSNLSVSITAGTSVLQKKRQDGLPWSFFIDGKARNVQIADVLDHKGTFTLTIAG